MSPNSHHLPIPFALFVAFSHTIMQPAFAMNDSVTGRWLTRDPLSYNFSVLQIRLTEVKHQRIKSKLIPDLANLRNETMRIPAYEYLRTNPHGYFDSRGLDVSCTTAEPVPPGEACNQYSKGDSYAGFGARCMCNCTPDSDVMNFVRGCLLCMHAHHADPQDAHILCYDAANDSFEDYIEFGFDVVCPCLKCADNSLTLCVWGALCWAGGH